MAMAKKTKKEQHKVGVVQKILKPFRKEEFKSVFIVHNRIRNTATLK